MKAKLYRIIDELIWSIVTFILDLRYSWQYVWTFFRKRNLHHEEQEKERQYKKRWDKLPKQWITKRHR